MSYAKSTFRHPSLQPNQLGYDKRAYEGALSTLCAGCGHDSVGAAIVQACFEANIEPHKVAKISGIGCSSKTPAYFLGKSHGFNSVHGRMPSVATGANMANRDMIYLGVSGDGDTASIGFGQFAHVNRRNLNMLYLVENNGCYGLTKGQDSATTDVGSASKKGQANPFTAIDLCATALEMGATFVARSFSGDKAQLVPLIKAALRHPGFAFIDVLSPCVTFNNTTTSTKSYDYVRDHVAATGAIDVIPMQQEITTDYQPGSSHEVTLHDGSVVHLYKGDVDLDVTCKVSAQEAIRRHQLEGAVLTGLLYIDPQSRDFHQMINSVKGPLRDLDEAALCPGQKALDAINASFR